MTYALKCYDCALARAATGIEEIDVQDAYTFFRDEPICRDHLAGRFSVMLNLGSNIVLQRLS